MEASQRPSESGRIRRSVEAIAFVAIWVAAGELLSLSPNAYLLFGIPLTAGFQLLVRRRPIKELWVRYGPDLSLRTVSLKLAIPLAIVPFVSLVKDGGSTSTSMGSRPSSALGLALTRSASSGETPGAISGCVWPPRDCSAS